MKSTTPYTYRIKWTALNLSYYGVRIAKGCDPSDFWVKYFTSSNHVKNIIAMYGNPDVIEIRKTFSSSSEAYRWETRVLKRLKVKTNQYWLNQNDNTGFIGSAKKTGRPKNFVTMRNPAGNIEYVHVNDPRIKLGELVHPTKGTKTVLDTETMRYVRIDVSNTDPRYQSINKGYMIVIEIESNTNVRIKTSEFDPAKHKHGNKTINRKPLSQEERKRRSDKIRGENNPMYGKPGTFTGKTHSQETKDKIKQTKLANKLAGKVKAKPTGPGPATGKKWFTDGSSDFLVFPDDPSIQSLNLYPGRVCFKKKSPAP